MLTARRRRTTWAILASIIAHLAVVIFAVLQRPTLPMLAEEHGPPEAVIPVLIMPKTPPPAAGRQAQPAPIRLHRRPQRFVPPDIPTLPVPAPAPAETPAPASPRGPVAIHPAPEPEGPKGDVRTALRQGAPGCANPDAVGLTKAERDLCDEKFGKGAKSAPFLGLALNPAKAAAFDKAASQKEGCRRYREGMPPGLSGSSEPGMPSGLGEGPVLRNGTC